MVNLLCFSTSPRLLAPLLTATLISLLCAQDPEFGSPWKKDPFATEVYEINGTGGRSNPLRRKLKSPIDDEELFVRYRIRYDKTSIDTPENDEGEFLVLWLDQSEGNSGSTHSGGVPNVGIHVSGNENRFMVRYAPQKEHFSTTLEGDRDYQIVARLWKSQSGPDQPFDQLNLWVDPEPEMENSPDASVESSSAITSVSWIGFSTGAKTELEDRIFVWDVTVGSTWAEILELPNVITPQGAPQPVEQRTIDFDLHVLPILESRCFACHSGPDAELRLDVHDEVLNLCPPGQSEESHLFQQVVTGRMPPEDELQLSKSEINQLKKWIDEGVVWNAKRLPAPRPTTDHWSFQPIVRPKIPTVERSNWVRTPVDAFIARKQEAVGTKPSSPADHSTLARRMSLDMLGLPPTNLYQTVDQLLANPAYGERWARHWLDVSRWAESNGHQHNRFRPYAWRYRDWVIDAFNHDLPFDQFLRQQIAGDSLSDGSSVEENALVATGFLAAARYSGNELDKRIQRNDILVDVVNTTANAFLGLTFECAQCHTHKFDPISLRDYYRLQAFFADGQPVNVSLPGEAEKARPLVRERWEIFDRTYQRMVKIRRRRGNPTADLVIPKTVVANMNPTDKLRFQQLEQNIAGLDQTWAYCSTTPSTPSRIVTPHEMRWPLPRTQASSNPQGVFMLLRGDVNAPGPRVQAGWPLVFGETPDGIASREALAAWMTSRQNPLTARVWVNRIWTWHFGSGLVPSISDFGIQGTNPTHPELLDFLASELMDHNWSTNHIHRLILNSATYRQSSVYSQSNAASDPGNATYWRWTPRRLESEAIRDSMLSASKQLDRRTGGPSDAAMSKSKRRSIYLRQHRQRLPMQQTLFDGDSGNSSCSRRLVSTNALQPLWLLNADFSQQAAAAMAMSSGSIESAFERCLGRKPKDDERSMFRRHVKNHGLESACLVLFNSSEFLYLP